MIQATFMGDLNVRPRPMRERFAPATIDSLGSICDPN
jgi:hypothetical protein